MITEHNEIRIAAVADLHIGIPKKPSVRKTAVKPGGRPTSPEIVEKIVKNMASKADILIFAGDLTHNAKSDEAELFAQTVKRIKKPMFAVFGNHDINKKEPVETDRSTIILEEAGVVILQADIASIEKNNKVVNLVGIQGGYDGTLGSDFNEKQQRHLAAKGKKLQTELDELNQPFNYLGNHDTIFLTHYSPILETVIGEPEKDFGYLGSTEIGRLADTKRNQVKVVFHGHAHRGQHRGVTKGGIPVVNVALPVLVKEAGLLREDLEEVQPMCIARFSQTQGFQGTCIEV